ncbi:hypothetical protein [Desulfonatronum thioautotrophicum]|uniref:hypothetical protein n=1 Tax=Desulfonatronum thioautotrophicum TaxID=617001 RepID=UPI0012948234|nr:hypothetical protein [Desulfonatronum thioautotrophicum]
MPTYIETQFPIARLSAESPLLLVDDSSSTPPGHGRVRRAHAFDDRLRAKVRGVLAGGTFALMLDAGELFQNTRRISGC